MCLFVVLSGSLCSAPSEIRGFSDGSAVKYANAGDAGFSPGWGRSPGGGNGNPFQYSCMENPMDREA